MQTVTLRRRLLSIADASLRAGRPPVGINLGHRPWRRVLATCGAALVALAAGACDATSTTAPPDPVAPIGLTEAALSSTVTFQRKVHGSVADATLSASDAKKSLGASDKLIVSKKKEVLLRFDLAEIPANAVVNSATLKLYLDGHEDRDEDDDADDCDGRKRREDEDRRGYSAVPIEVRRATAPWVEGTVTYKSFNQQFDSEVAGLVLPNASPTFKQIDLKQLVQAWVSGNQANFGVLLKTTTHTQWRFASSENGKAAYRPALVISYTTPDDHCAPSPCQNGGDCTNGATSYTCHCPPGFSGQRCETDIDDCSGDPCVHGSCADGIGTYECTCAAGYRGTNCDDDIDDCQPPPCQHGGVCTDGVASHACACPVGFSGDDCETLVDNCASAPCQNDGVCHNGVGDYTCACPAGLEGKDCQINPNNCPTVSPCQNGGLCVDGLGAYACSCPPGWAGSTCAINLDSCALHPCANDSACANDGGSYVCSCTSGYSGTNCETDIDDCAVNACQNDSRCVDEVAGYACRCSPFYTGARCDVDVDECGDDNGGCPTDYTCQNNQGAAPTCIAPNHCVNVTCAALDACHVAGVCEPTTGVCSMPNAADGTTCDDGDAATGSDACHAGTCAGVAAPVTCPCFTAASMEAAWTAVQAVIGTYPETTYNEPYQWCQDKTLTYGDGAIQQHTQLQFFEFAGQSHGANSYWAHYVSRDGNFLGLTFASGSTATCQAGLGGGSFNDTPTPTYTPYASNYSLYISTPADAITPAQANACKDLIHAFAGAHGIVCQPVFVP